MYTYALLLHVIFTYSVPSACACDDLIYLCVRVCVCVGLCGSVAAASLGAELVVSASMLPEKTLHPIIRCAL